ncbi:hypothetical protein BKA70DRAFT_775593 [Coprinopsis sp. MPI-PUGE-AT-0042]|nr:hypothetical protein BKA70DRAFT_775593 [Coprinopsis sp. MPI-PUGE-AT-0042]
MTSPCIAFSFHHTHTPLDTNTFHSAIHDPSIVIITIFLMSSRFTHGLYPRRLFVELGALHIMQICCIFTFTLSPILLGWVHCVYAVTVRCLNAMSASVRGAVLEQHLLKVHPFLVDALYAQLRVGHQSSPVVPPSSFQSKAFLLQSAKAV